MKVSIINNYYNQNFKAIKLTAEETKSAEKIIKTISGKGNVSYPKLDTELFTIFLGHLKYKANIKIKGGYFYKEVMSELSLLFSEILKEIKENGGGLKTLISKLDKYQSSKEAKDPENCDNILDEDLYPEDRKTPLQGIDLITEADLIIPESAEVAKQRKATLNTLVEEAQVSSRHKNRMKKLIDGKRNSEIAKEEQISSSAVTLSKKRATLEIQKNKGIIPKEIYDKAKEIKNELELNLSEDDIVNFLIKQPQMIGLSIDILKDRFNAVLSLFNCNRNIIEKMFINNSNISGTKTETLQNNIKNISKILGITEEETIELGIKVPYILSLNTDKLEDKIQGIASIMNSSYDDVRTEAIKQPAFLISTPESIKKKKELRFYYNNLTNNKNNDLSVYGIYSTSYKRWYEAALAYIFTGKKILQYGTDGKKLLIDHIKSLSKDRIYEYNIPKGEIAFDLINYAEQLSEKLLGKNVFKFNTVSDFEPQKEQLAALFGLSDEKIAEFTEENPFILYSPIETINEHLQNFANSLDITKDKALETAMKYTDIFVYPAVIKEKILNATEKLGGADKELIDKLLKNPNFYKSKLEKSKFDKLSKKKALKEYYCKLTNKKYKESSIFSQLKKPDRYFYNGILAFIIAGKRGMIISEEFPYNNGASLTEIISGMKNPVYEYNIPDGEVAEGFIQYAENLSTKIHGKNIFKFNVIKEEN